MSKSKGTLAATAVRPTDAEVAGLKGPVKMARQIRYKTQRKFGAIVKGKVDDDGYANKHFSVSYSEKGTKTEELFYHAGGRNSKIIYNDRGLPAETYTYYSSGYAGKVTMAYDEQGRTVEQVHYDANGNITNKMVSKFDQWGNQTEMCNTNGQGTITSKFSSKFIALGKPLESSSTDGKGVTVEHFWKYDEMGNDTEVRSYRAGALLSSLIKKYTYDKNGIKREYSQEHFVAEKNETRRSVFKCNDRGDVIEVKHFDPEGNLTESRVFTPQYDEQGNLIKPVYQDDEEEDQLKSETEECENDKHGNWIKKTSFYNNSDSPYKRIPVNIYIREITYYGEESSNETPPEQFFAEVIAARPDWKKRNGDDEDETTEKRLTPQQLTWLSEASNSNDPFPVFRYYALTNKEMPSVLHCSGPYIEAYVLLDELQDMFDAKVIYSYVGIWNRQDETLTKYVLGFPEHPEYLLQASQIGAHSSDEFEIPAFIRKKGDYDSGYLYFSPIMILRPKDDSRMDEYGEEDDFSIALKDCINKCTLRKKPDKPMINMIEVDGKGFTMREHAVNDDFEIKDLDINYGYGFKKFHDELMHRFNSSTKGLVLFHGQPGTGKTYYIRHLLRKMVSNRKVVIYMPPNMVDHLVEPGFMTFLTDQVQSWSEEGFFCVLLIEDAEPLLAKRVEGVRIQGITNLLNMSDGILNDMLNLQIICTFNVDLKKLDSALLRPGRLIARKEFKALSELDANLLAQRLGIKHHFTAPATLGEIYAMRKNSNTLIHDVEQDKNSSTAIDDLF